MILPDGFIVALLLYHNLKHFSYILLKALKRLLQWPDDLAVLWTLAFPKVVNLFYSGNCLAGESSVKYTFS